MDGDNRLEVWCGLGQMVLKGGVRAGHMGWGCRSIFIDVGGIFSRYTHLEVGDRSRIRFWLDLWCGDRLLKEAFHGVHKMAREQEASKADLFEQSNGVVHWNARLFRAAHDWEVDAFIKFYNLLNSNAFPWRSIWKRI